jgi:thiol-disulfide isomerase/thioredoxin
MKYFYSMKRPFLALIAVVCCILSVSAQPVKPNQPATDSANAQAPYMRFPTLPPFHLLKLDSSSYLTKDDVKKNRKTIVMYFSPDCEHCKHEIESFLSEWNKFKDIEIVMATYQPFSELKEFNSHYKIYEHSNIHIGRDEKFFLPPFYKIRNLPYLALYDKKGELITTFEGTQKVGTLMDAFAQKK